MDLLSFILGAIFGGLIAYAVLRPRRSTLGRPPEAADSSKPAVANSALSTPPTEENPVDLDAQRLAAAARIRDQREASRALRETKRLAEEAAAQVEAQRLAEEADARAEAGRIAAEAAAQEAAQRLAQEEAQRLEANALAEAKRLAEEAAAQVAAQRLAEEVANARAEAERIAAEAAAQEAAQRLAQEEAQRLEANALAEAKRLAEEAAAQVEAQRLAEEADARAEAERLAQEAAAAEVVPPVEAQLKSPAETLVMIVDDSKVGRIKTNRVLLSSQYQVQMAVDGRDAVNKIAATLPDIVITDVEMPEMDGFELTAHIRSNPATAHLPVIIVSGSSEEYALRAKEVGADFMLGKPYTDSDMIAHVQRLLRSRL